MIQFLISLLPKMFKRVNNNINIPLPAPIHIPAEMFCDAMPVAVPIPIPAISQNDDPLFTINQFLF